MPNMSIGFTGTRSGMTKAQAGTLEIYLHMFSNLYGPKFRHGQCRGADLQAAAIAIAHGYEEEPFPAGDDPLGRNRIIVRGSWLMFATPNQDHEILRSGTWATIRYANKVHVPGITIWPDGHSDPMVTMAQLPPGYYRER